MRLKDCYNTDLISMSCIEGSYFVFWYGDDTNHNTTDERIRYTT